MYKSRYLIAVLFLVFCVAFEISGSSTMTVTMPAGKLEALDVKYILTNRDLSGYEMESVSFSCVKQGEDYRIYQVTYS